MEFLQTKSLEERLPTAQTNNNDSVDRQSQDTGENMSLVLSLRLRMRMYLSKHTQLIVSGKERAKLL